MKPLIHIIWLLVTFNLGDRTMAQRSGSIIPLYSYPRTNAGGNAWQRLLDAYRAHPIPTWAIVNVNNGPGTTKDSNYASAIDELHSAGINTMGYVYTSYYQRIQNDVKADIDRWKSLYNVKGIFFDEMTNDNDNAKVNYYRDLNNYAKQQGFTFTVGNPGTSTTPEYFDTVDTIMTYESAGMPSKDRVCSQDTNGKGRNSVSIIPYKVASLNEAQINEVKCCAGYIYVTDDDLPNPWDTLPSYLTQLFRILRRRR